MIDISIIIPIYNVEKYLEKCLESIFSIIGIKKEIILINDGSTDNSYLIIEKYKSQYKDEIIVINQKNKGLSGARNSGLKIAKGEYVYFIDSDDYINSTDFIKLFKNGKKKNLDIIIGQAVKVYENTFKKDEKNPFPKIPLNMHEIELTGFEFWKECLKKREYNVVVWNKIYKREFLEKNRICYIENLLHEDIPFTFKCFILSKRIGFYKYLFYYYRQRNESIMKTMNSNNYTSILEILKYLLELYEKYKINNKYYNNYLITVYWKNYSELIKLDNRNLILKKIILKNKLGRIEKIRKFILKIRMKYAR